MKPNQPEPSPEVSTALHRVAENLYRREPSGIYYAILKRDGKQIWRSLKTTDRKLAERRLAEFAGRADQLRPQNNPHIGFPQLAAQWLDTRRHTLKQSTADRIARGVKAVAPFFAGVSVRNATRRHCDDWLKRRGPALAPQTFAHELDVLRNVFKHAMDIGLRVDNPAAHIKRKPMHTRRPSVPTREQFRQLLAAIRASDGRPSKQAQARLCADLVELLAYTGCRLDEARNLRWRDVDFERDVFTVTGGEHGTKNHEQRTVPLNTALRQLLERLQSETNPQPADLIAQAKSAKMCLDSATKRLGLPHFCHHAFRHFWATTAIESGGDVPTVAKMLGHKDGGALLMKTYGHLRQEHAFAVARKINFGTEKPANVVSLESATAAK
jgi:integrase